MRTDFSIDLENTGLEVLDFREDIQFQARPKRERDTVAQLEAMQRLAQAFVGRPETILQELVNAAIELCGADSAGVSIAQPEKGAEEYYHWIATAGQYSGFLDAILPQHPSACSVSIDRGQAQHFRVDRRFFEMLGVEAPLVTDGILLPWVVGETRGTIFVMAHDRREAFDMNDVRVMLTLADFTALAVLHQQQQAKLMEQAKLAAEAAMARELAHQINNPLQSLTTAVYLTGEGVLGDKKKTLAKAMAKDVDTMATLVKRMMDLPARRVN